MRRDETWRQSRALKQWEAPWSLYVSSSSSLGGFLFSQTIHSVLAYAQQQVSPRSLSLHWAAEALARSGVICLGLRLATGDWVGDVLLPCSIASFIWEECQKMTKMLKLRYGQGKSWLQMIDTHLKLVMLLFTWPVTININYRYHLSLSNLSSQFVKIVVFVC